MLSSEAYWSSQFHAEEVLKTRKKEHLKTNPSKQTTQRRITQEQVIRKLVTDISQLSDYSV